MHLSLTLACVLGLICTVICQQFNPNYCQMKPSAWVTDESDGKDTYFVFSSLGCYRENSEVTVDLFSSITKPFVEFMVQANTKSDATKIGMWNVSSPYETINCELGNNNMVILKSEKGVNTTYVKLKWMPPANFDEDVVFNATFVDSRGNHFKKIFSLPITYNTTCGVVKNDTVRMDICNLVPTNINKRDSSSANNYGMILSQGCYSRNDVINVTLYSNIGHPFNGFVIQGRKAAPMNQYMAYGMWHQMENRMYRLYKMIDCHGNRMNTLSLSSSQNMTLNVASMQWTLGDRETPYNMVFNATVIDLQGRHIVNITSPVLRYDLRCPESPRAPITAGAPKTTISVMSLIFAVFMIVRSY